MSITSGTARVAGVDVMADPDAARRRIGVALQEVPASDEEAFAAALARAASRRRRISPERSAAVRRQYSTARLIQDIENLYAELLQDDGVL
jgi:glycosyltransferase involved in cell wall biosynthesis